MVTVADLINEFDALDAAMSKTAHRNSSSGLDRLAQTLDKVAEEMESSDEEDDEKKKKKEMEDEEEKSASMNNNDLNKIANLVVSKLQKIAVADVPGKTQGSVVNITPGDDGAATAAARAEDQIIDGDAVANAAARNSEKNAPEGGSNTLENTTPNVEGSRPDPLQKGASVVYTAAEAATLQKFASIGYEAVVEGISDEIVQEKIAEAIVSEQAKQAPEKIAQALMHQAAPRQAQKTASVNQEQAMRVKLAEIGQKDPALLQALKVFADRNLL